MQWCFLICSLKWRFWKIHLNRNCLSWSMQLINAISYLSTLSSLVWECICSAVFGYGIIDPPLLGLHRHQGQHRFHTIQKRYEVFANAVSNFAIIQFGICTYRWSQTANRYFAKPFNFYVFPRGTKGRKEMNRCFGVQGAAFDFLTTCGFDFNKVSYLLINIIFKSKQCSFGLLDVVGVSWRIVPDRSWRRRVREGNARKA